MMKIKVKVYLLGNDENESLPATEWWKWKLTCYGMMKMKIKVYLLRNDKNES